MRIGFDATWYNGSGMGTYIAGLLAAMSEYGDEVRLFVFEDPERRVPGIDDSTFTRVSMRSSKFTVAEQFEFRAHCKQKPIDVFHCPYQYGVPLLLPCPLVITVHDLIPLLFRTRNWHKQLAAMPFVKWGYRTAATRARHVIADSANTANDLQRILRVPAHRITPIHLAVSPGFFHSAVSPGESRSLAQKYGLSRPYVVVGSAGCNWRTKNVDTALESVAVARRHAEIDFQVAIYGPRKALDELKNPKILSELNVRYLGYVPVEDMGAVLRNAELFVTASLYEGFGLPILEAMSCGCPVVTSSGGSLAEVAGEGALVFEPGDAKGIARAIAHLLSNKKERERWRERALARAAEFSWHKAAERTIAVYRAVCDRVVVSKDLERQRRLADARDQQSA